MKQKPKDSRPTFLNLLWTSIKGHFLLEGKLKDKCFWGTYELNQIATKFSGRRSESFLGQFVTTSKTTLPCAFNLYFTAVCSKAASFLIVYCQLDEKKFLSKNGQVTQQANANRPVSSLLRLVRTLQLVDPS